MDFKRRIADNLPVEGFDVYANLSAPTDSRMGDYCLPCFRLSKTMKKAPQAIAEELKNAFAAEGIAAETAGGYLNFRIDRATKARAVLTENFARGEEFAPAPGNGRTITVDYSSINIAKPFHIGHLLTTAIGGSLCRIFRQLGYNVVGINHLGDWGTQFGKLIAAYLKWGDESDVEARGIHALLELYVRFHKEAETDPSLEDEGRRWFKAIEDGDSFALGIFERFKAVTLRDVEKVYKRLGIRFDSYAGESFYNDKMQPIIDELAQKGLLTDSEGAKVVDLDAYGMPPCLILKSDGATLYATRDLAAACYRHDTYRFYKNLYVVAYQQTLHFKQVFKVLELMGRTWAGDCVHVPFGMVSLEGSGALSTRSGNVVFLEDVLNTAVGKAEKIIEEKSPDLSDKAATAEAVGVGAVLFMALSTARIKDMVFSFDKALNFDGETGPYLQYTYARAASVMRKCGTAADADADFSLLTDDGSDAVITELNRFDEVVADAAEKYEPSILSRYLIDLAQSFNRFYIDHRIAGEAPPVTRARLLLTDCVRRTLKNGMRLILLTAPERM